MALTSGIYCRHCARLIERMEDGEWHHVATGLVWCNGSHHGTWAFPAPVLEPGQRAEREQDPSWETLW